MATWKKVIVSGSQAHLQAVTASVSLDTPGAVGFYGTASWAQSASYVTGSVFTNTNPALSASYALTASYALNVSAPTFTISGSTGNGTFNASGDTLLLTGSNGLGVTVTDNTTVLTASFGFPTNASVQLGTLLLGDLTVTGTASFQNTENLLVADRFVLLASGSNAVGDGGIIVQQGTQNVGEALFYDSNTVRWSVSGSVTATSTGIAPDAFIAMVVDTAQVGSTDVAKYQKNGNIKIDNGDIWIYA